VIQPDATATIGNTPLVHLQKISEGLHARVIGKLEMRNPAGSVKDRVAHAMVAAGERSGILLPGMTIVEATGGNTGIGLAFVAAIKGYRLILTMPETMSTERVALLRLLGAEVRLTAGILMHDAVALARKIADDEGAVWLNQFENPANAQVHRDTTAEEIWHDTGGQVDVFVSAVGTGGTLTGVGEVLKARRPAVHCVAVEPHTAAVLSGRPAGPHKIPGIGVGFVPPVLNRSVIDEILTVSDEDAFAAARRLAHEGVLAGASSGAALHAAIVVAGRPEMDRKNIVVLLADSAERYVTTDLVVR
jgi:cysteine synthase A